MSMPARRGIAPSTGIKPAKDILHPREPLMLGVPEAISTIDAVHGLSLVKANFRAVTGYPGKAETRLALLRNEVNVDSQSTPLSVRKPESTTSELLTQDLFSSRKYSIACCCC